MTDLPPISDLPAAKSLLPFINAYMYLFFGGPETSSRATGQRYVNASARSLKIEPTARWPRRMKPGQPYLVEIDLLYKGDPDWRYEEEEFAFTFLLDGTPHVTVTALGGSTVILHRSGRTYGPARFVVVADERSGNHFLWLSLLTQHGLLTRTDQLLVTILGPGQDTDDEGPVLQEFASRVLARASQQAAGVPHHFIVQLTPYIPRPDSYLTTVWSQRASDYPVALLADDAPQHIDELPRQLEPVLAALRTRLPQTQLGVEFILPNKLLAAPVDEWVVNRKPLGLDHTVVVRSLDRMRYPDESSVRARWRSKWLQLQRVERSPAQLGLFASQQQLESQGREGHDLPGCLFLDFTPGTTVQEFTPRLPHGDDALPGAAEPMPGSPRTGSGTSREVVTQLVRAGVPVMLWPRQNHARDVEQVYSLTRTAGVNVLPLSVHELRRERSRSGTGVGSNGPGPGLSLLWDDPDRFPGRPAPLAAPRPQSPH